MTDHTTIALTLRAGLDLEASSPGQWSVIGGDPQFLLSRPRKLAIEEGRYWLVAEGGKDLESLIGPVIYIDAGHGFNERHKQDIRFEIDPDGRARALVVIGVATRSLRFDPCDEGRPTFGLLGLSLLPEPMTAEAGRTRDAEIILTARVGADLKASGPGLWSVTGGDPQFLLSPPRGRAIEAGQYWLVADRGLGLEDLIRPVVYVDRGQGFHEGDKQAVHFKYYPDGRTKAFLALASAARGLRLDPCDEGRPEFGLRGLTLSRRRSPTREDDAEAGAESRLGRPRVLLNLVRLLPEGGGAGGAGRLALAFLTHLPGRVRLRVAISPAWVTFIERFPEADFVIVGSDENAELAAELAWCDCYVDPLNGLRPKTIDPRVAVISLVLDLQHMRMPWLFSDAEMKARIAEYTYAIARSDRLVAISAYERDNLIAYYGVDRVSVAHLAGFMAEDAGSKVDALDRRREAARDESPYLIYPAVPWLHKNHEILVQALGVLKRRGVEIPLVLTNTSSKPAVRDRLRQVSESFEVDGLVRLEAFLSESELFDLFTKSRGMVFPSLYEGFGIPLVDAMALGVPVLATRTSAVPEIGQDAIAYFANGLNAVAMADDLEAFWGDEAGRLALREKGRAQARSFSSARMVANLLEGITAAIATKAAGGGRLPAPSRYTPPRYEALSVFVSYADLGEGDIATLRGVGDIDAFHASVFGDEADVTVGLDIGLVDDPGLRAVFASAGKLICFDGRHRASRDAAILDFSQRFDHAEFQLVTDYASAAFKGYSAPSVTTMLMALRLHAGADYAVIDRTVADCVVDAPPDERERALAYDRRRRGGVAVSDAMTRRSSARDLKNGSVAFLSQLCATYARLRVPAQRPA